MDCSMELNIRRQDAMMDAYRLCATMDLCGFDRPIADRYWKAARRLDGLLHGSNLDAAKKALVSYYDVEHPFDEVYLAKFFLGKALNLLLKGRALGSTVCDTYFAETVEEAYEDLHYNWGKLVEDMEAEGSIDGYA